MPVHIAPGRTSNVRQTAFPFAVATPIGEEPVLHVHLFALTLATSSAARISVCLQRAAFHTTLQQQP